MKETLLLLPKCGPGIQTPSPPHFRPLSTPHPRLTAAGVCQVMPSLCFCKTLSKECPISLITVCPTPVSLQDPSPTDPRRIPWSPCDWLPFPASPHCPPSIPKALATGRRRRCPGLPLLPLSRSDARGLTTHDSQKVSGPNIPTSETEAS